MAELVEHTYEEDSEKDLLAEIIEYNEELKTHFLCGLDEVRFLNYMGMNFWKRRAFPLRCFFDVFRYNFFVVPKINEERKNLKTKEEKESFSKSIQNLITLFTSGLLYESIYSDEGEKANYKNSHVEDINKMISFFGRRNLVAFMRASIDESLSKQIKLNLKNAKDFKSNVRALRHYSLFRDISVSMKTKLDTTILPLEINTFQSTPHNWRIMINNSKNEMNKKHEKGNEHLLD